MSASYIDRFDDPDCPYIIQIYNREMQKIVFEGPASLEQASKVSAQLISEKLQKYVADNSREKR